MPSLIVLRTLIIRNKPSSLHRISARLYCRFFGNGYIVGLLGSIICQVIAMRVFWCNVWSNNFLFIPRKRLFAKSSHVYIVLIIIVFFAGTGPLQWEKRSNNYENQDYKVNFTHIYVSTKYLPKEDCKSRKEIQVPQSS